MTQCTRALTLASALALASALILDSTLAVAGPLQGHELLRWGFQAGDTWQYRLTQNTSTGTDPVRDTDEISRPQPYLTPTRPPRTFAIA